MTALSVLCYVWYLMLVKACSKGKKMIATLDGISVLYSRLLFTLKYTQRLRGAPGVESLLDVDGLHVGQHILLSRWLVGLVPTLDQNIFHLTPKE